LAAFEKARPRLAEEGIAVIAASTDPLDKASETVKEHALGFPVGYALPVKETAATLGAFYEEKRGFLQATGFVVKPDRTIAVSRAIGPRSAPQVASQCGAPRRATMGLIIPQPVFGRADQMIE
jgi:peroxiredoxin